MARDAVVVVDMQEYFCRSPHAFMRFMAAIGGAEDHAWYVQRLAGLVIPNLIRLTEQARAHGDVVVVTEFGSRTSDGADLPPWARRHNEWAKTLVGEHMYLPLTDPAARTITELAPQHGDWVVARNSSGPLASTDVVPGLRGAGVRRVTVAGVATDVCVTGWTRELADAGFDVAVPEDACASPLRRGHESAMAAALVTFGTVVPTTAELTHEVSA
ncbi:MAG TPA: isochorismatase family cysteine hydrolase [Mycobacterium sp.]|nr:isochorismatase family cysteine hydrolase [Trebonia sp.]HTZ16724.1 isochorismatase family cysteine hydrolase [Mycobacterium sp.]